MREKIYLFGDSITEMSYEAGGWGASLANHFNRTVDVVLRGYNGYNTRWALKVIDKVFDDSNNDERKPLAVTVFFGANDACLPDRSRAFLHVPLDEYRQNLRSIVSYLKVRWPTTEVILISPPPIDEPTRLLYPFNENKLGLPERTNEAAGNYAKACLAVADECGVVSIDLWTIIQQIPDWQTACLSDGLHLSEGGNRVVFEEVVEALQKRGLSLKTLRVDLRVFEDIDPNDPLKSFQGI